MVLGKTVGSFRFDFIVLFRVRFFGTVSVVHPVNGHPFRVVYLTVGMLNLLVKTLYSCGSLRPRLLCAGVCFACFARERALESRVPAPNIRTAWLNRARTQSPPSG